MCSWILSNANSILHSDHSDLRKMRISSSEPHITLAQTRKWRLRFFVLYVNASYSHS